MLVTIGTYRVNIEQLLDKAEYNLNPFRSTYPVNNVSNNIFKEM